MQTDNQGRLASPLTEQLGLAPERAAFERWAAQRWGAEAYRHTSATSGEWDAWQAAVAAERERAARVCDDEARMRTEAGQKHPEESESRGRCFAAARAAMNCAKGVRGGEVV